MIVATSTPRKWKIGAALIKWYQGGTEYSHVLLIKDDMVYQASHGWVNCMYLDNFTKENKIVDVYIVPDDKVDFEYAKRQIGKKYSLFQLFKIGLKYLTGIKLSHNGDKRFICSEYVGKCLKLAWVNDYTDPREIVKYLSSENYSKK